MAICVDVDVDEIDEELKRRMDAEVEARVRKVREDMDRSIALVKEDMGQTITSTQEDMAQLTASLSDPGVCPFALVERCGRTECSDISICINCLTARNFIDRSPTFTDINDERVKQAVEDGLTDEAVTEAMTTFFQGIIDKYAYYVTIVDGKQEKVPRDIENIPLNELYIIRTLTEIMKQLKDREDESYNQRISDLIDNISKAICD